MLHIYRVNVNIGCHRVMIEFGVGGAQSTSLNAGSTHNTPQFTPSQVVHGGAAAAALYSSRKVLVDLGCKQMELGFGQTGADRGAPATSLAKY